MGLGAAGDLSALWAVRRGPGDRQILRLGCPEKCEDRDLKTASAAKFWQDLEVEKPSSDFFGGQDAYGLCVLTFWPPNRAKSEVKVAYGLRHKFVIPKY